MLQKRQEQEAASLRGDLPAALKATEQGLTLSVSIAGPESILKARALRDMGAVWTEKGDYVRAAEYFEQALAVAKKNNNGENEEAAEALSKLGDNALDRANTKKSLILYAQALQIRQNLPEKKKDRIAYELMNIAEAYRVDSDFTKALEYHEHSLDQLRVSAAPQDQQMIQLYESFGLTHLRNRNPDAAEECFENAIAVAAAIKPAPHKLLGSAYHGLGRVYRYRNQQDKAMELIQKAIEIDKRVYGESHRMILRRYSSIALILEDKGELKESLRLRQQIVATKIKTLGDHYPSLSADYEGIGHLLLKMRDTDGALLAFQKQMTIAAQPYGENHPDVIPAYTNLGDAELQAKRHETAIGYYEKAYKIAKYLLGDAHPSVARLRDNLQGAVWAKKEYDKRTKDSD